MTLDENEDEDEGEGGNERGDASPPELPRPGSVLGPSSPLNLPPEFKLLLPENY
jgi:hypothetical protein